MLYAFFWVIPRRLNFICRRFGTLCSIFIGRYLPMKMEQTECTETSAYKIQTPGCHPKESIHNSEHGVSLKSRILLHVNATVYCKFTLQLKFTNKNPRPVIAISIQIYAKQNIYLTLKSRKNKFINGSRLLTGTLSLVSC